MEKSLFSLKSFYLENLLYLEKSRFPLSKIPWKTSLEIRPPEKHTGSQTVTPHTKFTSPLRPHAPSLCRRPSLLSKSIQKGSLTIWTIFAITLLGSFHTRKKFSYLLAPAFLFFLPFSRKKKKKEWQCFLLVGGGGIFLFLLVVRPHPLGHPPLLCDN